MVEVRPIQNAVRCVTGYDTPTVGMIVGIVAVVVPAIVCVGIAIWVGQRTFRRRNHNRESKYCSMEYRRRRSVP